MSSMFFMKREETVIKSLCALSKVEGRSAVVHRRQTICMRVAQRTILHALGPDQRWSGFEGLGVTYDPALMETASTR